MTRGKSNFINLLALCLVLVAGLFLRLIFFSGLARGGDALQYAHAAYALSQGVFQYDAWAGMLYVGLYFPVAFFYWLLGPSDTSTLLFPIASSLAGIVFVYAIANLYAGRSAGLVAALIWAILPLDVYLATNLLPDGPLAALSIGSVYFFLLAQKSKTRRLGLLYGASALLALWAVVTKPIAIITLVYLIVTTAILAWPLVSAWFEQKFVFKLKNVLAAMGVLFLIPLLWAYYMSGLRFILVNLVRANNDLASFFFTGATQLDFGDIDFTKSDLMIFMAPLFLVSAIILAAKELKPLKLVILWAAVLFLYYEWGSVSLNPLAYSPLQPFQEARNMLFVLGPLVVLAGIYIGQNLKEQFAQWAVPSLAVISCIVAYSSKADLYTSGSTILTSTALLILLVATVLSPHFLYSGAHRIRHIFAVVLLGSLSLGMLQPFLPYHAAMFEGRSKILQAFRQSRAFWGERPELPIYSSSSSSLTLNYASNFDLGYEWVGLRLPGIHARIQDEPIPEGKSGYVVRMTDGYGIPIRWAPEHVSAPMHWWPEYVSPSGEVHFFRVLSPEEATLELDAAAQSLAADHSPENLVRMYGASVNAEDWPSLFATWIELHALDPDKYTLADLYERVLYFAETHPDISRTNLFRNGDFAQGMAGWLAPEDSEISFAGDGLISFRASGAGEGLTQHVVLQPNQIYLFSISVSTNGIPTDLLSVNGDNIPSSFVTAISPNNPTEFSAIFVTPDWDRETSVPIQLFVSKERGAVRLQQPWLTPIAIAEKSNP